MEEQWSTPYKQLLLIGSAVFVLGALLALALGTTNGEGDAVTGFGAQPGAVPAGGGPSPIFVSSGEILVPLEGYEYGEAPATMVDAAKTALSKAAPPGSMEAVEVRTVEADGTPVGYVNVLVVDPGVVTSAFEDNLGRGLAAGLGTSLQRVSVAGSEGFFFLRQRLTGYVFVQGNAMIEVLGFEGKDALRISKLLLQNL